MDKYMEFITSLLVLLFLLYRQRQIRQVRNEIRLILPSILILYGLFNLVNYFNSQTLTEMSLFSIALSLLILAAGMGAVRAYTVRLWSDGSVVFRQGTWLTISLWIVSVALHLAVDHIGRTGASTLFIYYGITLAVQSWVVQSRVRRSFLARS